MALKAGYAAMVVWLCYIVYSIQHMDAWNDDYRGYMAITAALAGLVAFPVYFVLIYWIEMLKK